MKEQEIFELIKECVLNIQSKKDKPIRIAINGIEGTGKTVFADKLTGYLNSLNIEAIQVSIDGFHFNTVTRYRQGKNSAKGYYEDSYDEISFVANVLESTQLDSPRYTPATHDLVTDEYLTLKPIEINNNTVIITDGAYLFKLNYRNHWDLKIYLKTDFNIAMQRGIERDKELLGGVVATGIKFKERYHKSSQLYIKENNPEKLADIIIDNSDFNDLKIVKGSQL